MYIKHTIMTVVILNAISTAYAAQVRLGNDLIKNSSAEDLYQRISNASKKGNTVVGDTPEATQKINLVAQQLTSGDKQQQIALINALKGSNLNTPLSFAPASSQGIMTELETLRAEKARLLGSYTQSGSQPANLDALIAELESLRKENEQLRKSGTSPKSGEESNIEPIGAGAPPPPPPPGDFGAPPPPPPLPPMGDNAGQDSQSALLQAIGAGTKLRKTGQTSIKVPDPLAANDPKLQDSKAQEASNNVAFDGLAQIVIDLLIGNENKDRSYTLYIKDKFYELVRANETFINRSAFDTLFANDKDDESFVAFANKKLAFTKSDTALYDNISSPNSTLLSEFATKIKNALFFQTMQMNALQDLYLQRYINTILVNLIVAQRPKVTPDPSNRESKVSDIGTPISRITSDGLVEEILNDIIAVVEKEGNTLSKDYVYELYDRLNYLRAHRDFLRYDTLISNTWRKIAREATDPILKAKYYPLLETVLLSSPQNPDKNLRALTRDSFFNKLLGQMIFNLDDFNSLLKPKSTLFNAIIDDHTTRLTTLLRTAVPISSLITSSIGKAKTIKDLQDLGAALSARISEIDKKDKVTEITSTLTNLPAESVTTITKAFNEILSPEALDETSQASIKTILEAELTKNAMVIAAKAAANAIVTAYRSANKAVDDEFYSQVNSNKLIDKSDLDRIYNANDRMASDLWSIFTQIKGFGANELNKIISKNTQYKALSSYGLLVKILRDVSNLPKSKDNPAFTVLINSLKALNDATLQKTTFYVDSVKESQELITEGLFKGKLSEVISKLEKYDIEGFIAGITQYINEQNPNALKLDKPVKTITEDDIKKLNEASEAQARKSGGTAEVKTWKPQTFASYVQVLKDNVVPALLEKIRNDLNELQKGSGAVIISGLPLEGSPEKPLDRNIVKRNLAVYNALAKPGEFRDIWTYVNTMNTIEKLKSFDPSKLATFINSAIKNIQETLDGDNFKKNYLNSVSEEIQKNEIIASIKAYLDDVTIKMNNLMRTVDPASAKTQETIREKEEEEAEENRKQSAEDISTDLSMKKYKTLK